MYSFNNDYSEFACKEITDRISQIGLGQNIGYGKDEICASAIAKIKAAVGREDVDVHFAVGGTQANALVISCMLRPYEGVIAVESGHINTHETGAIEATGHKVEIVKGVNGKITAAEIDEMVKARPDEHMVKPAAVYISNSTEIGTIYSKQELIEVSAACKRNGLYLFMDGARLGSALVSDENDLTLVDIAQLCDVFYIGGTKNGALLGEAIVIVHPALKKDFRYLIKNRGAMMAKGFVEGIQFDVLFTDNLYFKLASHAVEMAKKMTVGLKQAGISFLNESPTNQIFPIFDHQLKAELLKDWMFQDWSCGDKEDAVRLVCSWATDENKVDEFIARVKQLKSAE